MHITSKGINFTKDYQKDSYNNNKIMKKNKKDKDLLVTFKKNHTLKYVEI